VAQADVADGHAGGARVAAVVGSEPAQRGADRLAVAPTLECELEQLLGVEEEGGEGERVIH